MNLSSNSLLILTMFAASVASAQMPPPGPGGAVLPSYPTGAEMAMDVPIVPAATIAPLADKDAADKVELAAQDQLSASIIKASADLSAQMAKIYPLAIQHRDLKAACADPKADAATKQTSCASVAKVEGDLKPLEAEMKSMRDSAEGICQQQFQPKLNTFYVANDQDKAGYNKSGFNCNDGEKMVEDNAKAQPIACNMQPKKIRGAYGFGARFNEGSAPMPGPCGPMAGPAMRPLGKVACLNEKGQVTASALIFQTKFGKFLGANTRFSFDGDGRVSGWKAKLGPATTEVAIKGNSVVKTTAVRDVQTAKCEWPVDADALESILTGQPPRSMKPSHLTQ